MVATQRTLELLLTSCHKARLWQEVLALLTSMRSRRLEVSSSGLHYALHACEVGAQWQLALELGRFHGRGAMAALVAGSQWQRALVLPTDLTDRSMAALARATRWTAALELLTRRTDGGYHSDEAVLLSGTMAACGQVSHWE